MTDNIKIEASPEAFLLLVGKSAEQTHEYLANKKSLADTMHKLIVTEDTLARIERQATHYEEMSHSLEIEAAKHQVSVIKLEEEVDRLNFLVQQSPRKEELNEYVDQLNCAKEEINILTQDQKFSDTLIDVIRDREKSIELKLHNERLVAKAKIDALDDQVEHLKVQVEDSLRVQAFMESNLDPTEAQKKIYYLEKELEKTRKECDTNAGIIYNMHGQIAALAKRPACEKNSDTLIAQLISGVRRNDRRNVVNPVRALTGLKLSEVCRLVYPIMEWNLSGLAASEPRKRIMDYSVTVPREPIALGDGTENKDDSIIDQAIRYGANGGGPRVFEGVPPTKADQLYDRFGHAPSCTSVTGPYTPTVAEVKPREIEPLTPNVDMILGGTWREGLPPHCDQAKECETCASLPCRCADKEKDQICNYTWRPSAKEAADEVTRLLESKKDDNIPMGG